MAEKRKLMAEMDRVFRKVDEGVELFEDTMTKMSEANSENQREKFQDDLKKEIKKLQRLRDQIKGWQNSNEVKDKDKLAQYRKIIENRMEQFKDIERENKTKPHSKQGLNAEEKLDPKEKERLELIEFLQECLQSLGDQGDQIECEIERLQGSRRKAKRSAPPSKAEEDLKHRQDRNKFHVQQLELVMRLLNNEDLEPSQVRDIREDIEDYVARNAEEDFVENEYMYDDLDMGDAAQQLGGVNKIGTFEEPDQEDQDSQSSQSPEPPPPKAVESSSSTNGKRGTKGKATKTTSSASAKEEEAVAKARHVSGSESGGGAATAASAAPGMGKSQPTTPLRVSATRSGPSGDTSPPNGGATPPVLGYAKAAASAKAPEPLIPLPAPSGPTPLIPPAFPAPLRKETAEKPLMDSLAALGLGGGGVGGGGGGGSGGLEERSSPTKSLLPSAPLQNGQIPLAVGASSSAAQVVPALKSMAGAAAAAGAGAGDLGASPEAAAMLLLRGRGSESLSSEGSQEAMIPPILGASPLGRSPVSQEQKAALRLLDAATNRLPLPSDSERLRPYISRNPSKQPAYYAQAPPPLSDTLEYFHRLAPETLFFIFYYLEGTKAQYLAAKALKKQSWRFHKKYMMWFQRHEDPTAITDDYEQGTYVYFDFEKWAQRKKEAFTFEYCYLEDRDLS